MPTPKYFAAIETAQHAASAHPPAALEPFDFSVLAPKGKLAALKSNLAGRLLPLVYAFSRRFKPLLPLAGLLHVTREAQVREVLLRPDDFITPFGPEMAELGDGATFPLGLEGAEHDRMRAFLHKAVQRDDAAWIGAMSRDFTRALLDNSPGEIDVVADLLKRVPAEICLRYFGLECDDVDQFGDWTMALSAFLFGDPYGDAGTRKMAMNAQRRIDAVLGDALIRAQRRARSGTLDGTNAETLVERLAVIQQAEPLEDREIKALLMGLATGFIPTNTLAASNMLQELLARGDAWGIASEAARCGDLAAMRAVVMELGRLNPALAPGQWRYCPRDTRIEIDGRSHPIKAGTTLLVSTMSALRDPRAWPQPGKFRLDRKLADGSTQEPDLVFGVGPHWCLGKYLAIEQITALFAELLAREDLKPAPGRAGRMAKCGPFPRHLTMRFSSPAAGQTMFIVLAPVADETAPVLRAELAKLGNPAGAAITAALDATGLVHFCSLACIDTDQGPRLAFELTVDGSDREGLRAITDTAGHLLRPAFAFAGLGDGEDLFAFMAARIVPLHGKPWGATGLNYNGLGEFPVARIARQARFADFAGRVLRDYVASETARGSHPMLTLAHLRRLLRGDGELRADASPAQLALIDEAKREGWDAFHLQIQAGRLKLAQYKESSVGQRFGRFLASRDGRLVTWPLAGFVAVWAWLLGARGEMSLAVWLLLLAAKALAMGLFTATAVVGAYLFLLRRAEKRDVPDLSHAPLDKLRALAVQENPPGYAQNHILAVGTLKPGWFRALNHAVSLWGIRVLITYGFRPGLILNMGTIHFARWWRVPGTNKVAFYSNFDGSWESYLEDFITRARQGQSAAWSNWQGFPKTRFMMGDGARDGDSFKRWERIQQQLVPFWYARFPELTTDQIRANALIHSGLGLAANASEGEEWLRCFGSMPRTANRIETDEIQALVLRGMKRLRYSAALALQLPQSGEPLGEWLCWVRGKPMRPDGAGGQAACAALVDEGVLCTVPRPAGRPAEFMLANALTIAFGERPLTGEDTGFDPAALASPYASDVADSTHQAVFLALSAAGLARFEVPNCRSDALLSSMPYAFRMGMGARARVNGDAGPSDPAGWRWHDDPSTAGTTEAVLMLYASSPDRLKRMVDLHSQLIANHGGSVLSQTDCAPAFADEARADFEHFGYRDGISQPVIAGTQRGLRGVAARDVLEPGEMILGYANAEGYLPPSPQLPVEADVRGALPASGVSDPSRYPDFGEAAQERSPRDFGRNGTYLVLRELKQDVAGFEGWLDAAADQLGQGGLAELYRLVGQRPDREWIKAKLMGRWPSGRPLVGNPINRLSTPGSIEAELDNDFAYGSDDPHGLACPFGAHIRRTNPRDSKQPGDPAEQVITNRHRLLRRGRTYTRPETGEKGLLFASICADIERQFEFVQQFWANAPAFHGLEREPDPIIGSDPVDPRSGCPLGRVFTIPTAAGPIRIEGMKSFVQTMGGGYFFLPSRSALGWLSDTALYAPSTEPEGTAHD
ncbi:MAG: cytochrome P450 [Novosphingobium sp.]|uniref:cytochrome P450 n=1 Tax=Novosphingobium sp. TaxID=1874826 RepID=UPI0032BF197F